MTGKKFDDGKLRYDLVPPVVLEQLAAVLTFGAKKYGDNNWQHVPNADSRYYAAMMRHVEATRGGEVYDEESGLPHLAHALACVSFMLHNQLYAVKDSCDDATRGPMPDEPTSGHSRREYYKALYSYNRKLCDFLLRNDYLDRFMANTINARSYASWVDMLTSKAAYSLHDVFDGACTQEGLAFWLNVRDEWDAEACTQHAHKPQHDRDYANSVACDNIPDDVMAFANVIGEALGCNVTVRRTGGNHA